MTHPEAASPAMVKEQFARLEAEYMAHMAKVRSGAGGGGGSSAPPSPPPPPFRAQEEDVYLPALSAAMTPAQNKCLLDAFASQVAKCATCTGGSGAAAGGGPLTSAVAAAKGALSGVAGAVAHGLGRASAT